MSYTFIYLASASPRRKDLLKQIGVSFKMLLPSDEENIEALETINPGESSRHYVMRVAALKAGSGLVRLRTRRLADAPLLAADTTVVLGRRILAKPADRNEAEAMLLALSGRTHRVLTAVAVAHRKRLDLALNESHVTMRTLTPKDISRYISSREPFGKAGAYGIQGHAAAFVTHITGSHSGIVGLPLAETAQLLASFGVDF
jgi:septum formation protein